MSGRRVLALLAVVLGLGVVVLGGGEKARVEPGAKYSGGWEADAELVAKGGAGTNYDEAKVPEYELADVLVCNDGTKVTGRRMWRDRRRGEILEMFQEHVYGRAPVQWQWFEKMTYDVFESSDDALGGKARRRQVRLNFTGEADGPGMDMLIYVPAKATVKVPVFLLLNFQGNHAVNADPAIRITESWVRSGGDGAEKNRATEASRGSAAKRFPIEAIIERGYGIATIYYGDIDPDFHDEFKNGVHGALDPSFGREDDSWGSVSAWAWGLSRARDYFETQKDVNAKQVILVGHSRLGKTSLWAGAMDDRFAMVVSNDSGCGGAALSRRAYGETVKRINTSFPHWFCENYKKYNDNEGACPVDQHMLIASIAPRPVYVASADKDLWADPRGEFLSCKEASGAYELYGDKGLGVDEMPPLDTPVQIGKIGYHVRSGGHDLTEWDWQRYMDFADKNVRN